MQFAASRRGQGWGCEGGRGVLMKTWLVCWDLQMEAFRVPEDAVIPSEL